MLQANITHLIPLPLIKVLVVDLTAGFLTRSVICTCNNRLQYVYLCLTGRLIAI